MPNRLANETSPYLLQHQHNPVDWYPWGQGALELARQQNKPIFLSVGYSTCYWCHVMERQCFENADVAAVMNEKFINIKVDREERPDVDQLYMTAVQVLTRHGGWPMSVWLTPDLRPFYGGTYFPPTDQHGRPGFVTLLYALEDAYRNRREEVEQTATQLVGILQRVAEPERPARPIRVDDVFIDELVQRSTSDYDPEHGGFGGAPKFPRETLLELLLVYLQKNPKPDISKRVLHTLDAIAAGGIRDHLGGGFHRYSTDAQWLVPHFEIMLYDNAMLAWCYAEAFRQTGEHRFKFIASDIFQFVRFRMRSKSGAFYTAWDAEVDGREGLNYLWTPEQIEEVLGSEDARLFNRIYGLDLGPNFADPHHGSGTPDANVLYLPNGALQQDKDYFRLSDMRQKLLSARDRRKQPLLDTKVLTSWNALMIRALAYAGRVFEERQLVEMAADAADFLLRHHRRPDGTLLRGSRDGVAKQEGFLDDYAFTAQAFLELHRAGDERHLWQDHARSIVETMRRKFGDDARGGFYFTEAGASDMIVRQKTASDSPLPSGNAVAAMVLLELGEIDAAQTAIAAFSQQIQHNGESMSSMVQAALQYLRGGHEPMIASAGTTESSRPQSPQQLAAEVVQMSTDWRDALTLIVQLSIRDGYHINANTPGNTKFPMIATRLAVEGFSGETTIEYPPAEVYRGHVAITVRFDQPATSPLRLSLNYQACDDSACLPPATKRLEVSSSV